MKLFVNLKHKYLSLHLVIKIIIPVLLIGLVWFLLSKKNSQNNFNFETKTTTVEKGTLVTSISATGSITSGNNTNIYTSASGEVLEVYVKNGDTVRQGQKLAQIKLDQDGQKKQTSAWASYLSAKNSVASSQQNKLSLENGVETAKRTLASAQDAVDKINDYTKSDLEKDNINSALVVAKRSYDIALQKFNSADSAIAVSQSQLSSAWYTYQQSSATIYAPASGVLSNFALTKGMSVANLSSDSTNSSNNATQSVGIITNPNNKITASVNLTEIDVTKVTPGQKVTLTLDAFPDKTFTGEVLAINTNGQSTSGVASYSTIITFDTGLPNMYPNMTVNANIIIESKPDILLIPSTAIEIATDGTASVQVVKDGITTSVAVTLGSTNDNQTEIVSGLNQGDVIISSSITNQSKYNNNKSSDFSSSNNRNNNRGGSGSMMFMNAGGPPGM